MSTRGLLFQVSAHQNCVWIASLYKKNGDENEDRHIVMSVLRFGLVWFIVFNVTFNTISVISWQSVLLVEETRGPRENHSFKELLPYFI